LSTFGFDRVYHVIIWNFGLFIILFMYNSEASICPHISPCSSSKVCWGKRVTVKIVSLGGIAVGKLLIVSDLKIRHRVPKHQDKHGTKIWGSPVFSLWCEHTILGKT